MKRWIRSTLNAVLAAAMLGGPAAMADTIFTIDNPPVDVEVIDAEPFDGIGDNGPFSTFNDALLGTEGEARSMAEFDLLPFVIPPGEYISLAIFQVRLTSVDVYGLGVDGETPASLGVDGYIGNGLAELSDFQAGNGNLLDSIPTPDPYVGQVLIFDVTAYVTQFVNAGHRWLGLTLRAESFGGLMAEEWGIYPRLVIETVPEPGTLVLMPLAGALLLRRRWW